MEVNENENKKNENENEDVDVIDETELTTVIKDAVKEAHKELKNNKMIVNEDFLNQLVEERLKQKTQDDDIQVKRMNIVVEKYLEFGGKKKILKMLHDETERCLLKCCALDPDDPDYERVWKNYEKAAEAEEHVRNNPIDKIDWTKILTVCIIIGAAAMLIFLLLIVENSQYFMRSRNALNLILSLFKIGVKI